MKHHKTQTPKSLGAKGTSPSIVLPSLTAVCTPFPYILLDAYFVIIDSFNQSS